MKIVLINAPFYPVAQPPIQVSLLSSLLRNHGHKVEVVHLNLDLFDIITPQVYKQIQDSFRYFMPDFFFSEQVFGKESVQSWLNIIDNYDFKKNVLDIRNINKIRSIVVDKWLTKIRKMKWKHYDLIGFSCSFSQLIPSIAIAKVIKEGNGSSTPYIVFGGRSLSGHISQEMIRSFSFIDYVVQNDAEIVFPKLIKQIENGEKIYHRVIDGKMFCDLDSLPTPDYSTYFTAIQKTKQRLDCYIKKSTGIPIEFSRGCWWGEKKRCRFCGEGLENLKYRRKETDRIIYEVEELVKQYSQYEFSLTDLSLDFKIIKKMLPILREQKFTSVFFTEIRPEFALKHMALLRDAGFKYIQPGIESLNTNVLKIMNKGTTALLNIRLLKEALIFNVSLSWNIIYGFPGEKDSDYQSICEIIPLISHLEPPENIGKLRLDRFSPFFRDHQSLFKNVHVPKEFASLFPNDWNLFESTPFLEYELETNVRKETYKKLFSLVYNWKKSWMKKTSRLEYSIFSKVIHIADTRFKMPLLFELRNEEVDVVRILINEKISKDTIVKKYRATLPNIQKIINKFYKNKLLLFIDDGCVWLPVPRRSDQIMTKGTL